MKIFCKKVLLEGDCPKYCYLGTDTLTPITDITAFKQHIVLILETLDLLICSVCCTCQVCKYFLFVSTGTSYTKNFARSTILMMIPSG